MMQERLMFSDKEKKPALDFRQKHVFDRLTLQDPYAWALDQNNLICRKIIHRHPSLTTFI